MKERAYAMFELFTLTNFLTLVGVAAIIVAVFIGVWVISLRRVVPTNMVHIVQRRSETTSYGKGKTSGNVYYHWPDWMPVIGVTVSKFPESVFDISLNNYEAYDAGRLPFVVDVKAFFRIDQSDSAANRVASFEELKGQLQAVLQGAVRRILGTEKLEVIMEDRSGLGNKFTSEVNSQLKEWGVTTVKSIEFMDIRDANSSNVIANIMAKEQSRIDMESRVAVAENNQTAQLKELDANRTVAVQRQEAEQLVGLRTAEKEKTVGIAKEEATQEIKAAARVTAERSMDVVRVEQTKTADIQREVAQIAAQQRQAVDTTNAETEKRVRITKAAADSETAVTLADGNAKATRTEAEGRAAAQKTLAEGIRAEGEARGAAEQAVLMAPVNTQIALAHEIGENKGYQEYLLSIRTIEVNGEVGKAYAASIKGSDLKVIANASDVQAGLGKITDILTPKGGASLSGALATLAATPEGAALVNRLTGFVNTDEK